MSSLVCGTSANYKVKLGSRRRCWQHNGAEEDQKHVLNSHPTKTCFSYLSFVINQ